MTELFFGANDDFEVAEFPTRKVIDEIEMVMTAFDCVLADDTGVYCSSELTSGKRYCIDLLAANGVHSNEELIQQLGEEASAHAKNEFIKASVARSMEFTETLRERGLVNVVNPGPFYARGFDQQHYLYLWEWVIIKKIYQIHFNEDWEYSNGCTLEYAIAARKGIPRLNHLGAPLDSAQAAAMIERGISELKTLGFSVERLERNLSLLRELT